MDRLTGFSAVEDSYRWGRKATPSKSEVAIIHNGEFLSGLGE
jgi:hypothetical protein